MAARQIAELLGLPAVHAEEIGGAGHVDIEKGAAHQEVRGFRRDVLGELGQPLRGDHAGQTALATAAHQVGHGAERQLARFVRNLARNGRCKQLRLVHHDKHGIPMIALGIEHAAEKGRRGPHLLLDIEAFKVEHHGYAMFAHTTGNARQFGFGARGVDDLMAESVRQRHEVAFGIDDALLHPGCALFQQTAQQMRLAGAGIALHQQARRQQFLKIQLGGGTASRSAHIDVDLHPAPLLRQSLSIQRRGRRKIAAGFPQARWRSRLSASVARATRQTA